MGSGCIFPPIPATESHIWRQRFPDGTPEQVTFGVTEEEGIHFAPDGRSFVTSIGTSQSTVWVHDSRGDRQITSEGYAFCHRSLPMARSCITWCAPAEPELSSPGGLWVADLESGQRQRLLPDFQMQHYTISADGQRVVFAASDDTGRTPVWMAALNGRTAPRRLTTMDSWVAYFGAPGEVVFEGDEKGTLFIYRIKEDGSDLQKMIPTPMLFAFGVSPDGRWVAAQDSRAWGALSALSGWRWRAHPDLRRSVHRRRAPTRYLPDIAVDAGRQIRVSEVRRTPPTRFRCSRARRCRRYRPRDFNRRKPWPLCPERAWSRRRERVSRSQSIDLCVYESRHAAQHLPGSRAVRPRDRAGQRSSGTTRNDCG